MCNFVHFFIQSLNRLNYSIVLFIIQLYGLAVFLMGFPFIFCYFATNITQNLLSIADVKSNHQTSGNTYCSSFNGDENQFTLVDSKSFTALYTTLQW